MMMARGAGVVGEHLSGETGVPPTQVHPVYTSHYLLQPSPEILLPSSQFLSYLFPSPQTSEQIFKLRLGVTLWLKMVNPSTQSVHSIAETQDLQ